MSDSPICVTLKSGKDYSAHWAVFKGSSAKEVRDHLIDYFELQVDDSLSLHEVVLVAEGVIHGGSNVASALGAKPVKAEKTEPKPKPEPVEDPSVALVAKMEAAPSLEDLRQLWFDNKAVAARSDEVKAAYTARGKALKEA